MTDTGDMKEQYIESLRWMLEEIKSEILEYQNEVQTLFSKIEIKQEQADHLMKLLTAENHSFSDPDSSILGNISVPDIAYELLNSQGNPTPLHYKKLTHEVLSKGIMIPGKDPAANLLSQINRDNRFVRTAPGTYGLKDWGLSPNISKRQRSRRKKR